jgi:peptidoglycan hydrolase CwlO-like protein
MLCLPEDLLQKMNDNRNREKDLIVSLTANKKKNTKKKAATTKRTMGIQVEEKVWLGAKAVLL